MTRHDLRALLLLAYATTRALVDHIHGRPLVCDPLPERGLDD